MNSFILIAVCMLAGFLFRKFRLVPENAHKGINAWIIYLALPAVSFKYLPQLKWSSGMLLPALTPVLICGGALLYISLYTQVNPVDKATKGSLRLVTGLSNTSFVGFPLILAWFSEQEIGIAVICDQVTFLLFSSVGLIIATYVQDQARLSPAIILHRLVTFPPFVGCVLALTVPRLVDITPVTPLFSALAATVAPLALFSIGLQLSFNGWQKETKHMGVVLVYKLIIAPALVLIAALLLHRNGPIAKISVFEAAMPVLLSAGILADDYRLNPRLTNLVIGISILISLLTTAIWYYVVQSVL